MIAEDSVAVQQSPTQGRYEVAIRSLKKGDIIFSAEPYGHAVFENFKKRVCARCCKYNQSGAYHERCSCCNQAWYCSPTCASLHGPEEHSLACAIYQGLRGLEKDEVAFLRCVINVLVRRHRELVDTKTGIDGLNAQRGSKRVSYVDVEALCEHRDAWTVQERQGWRHMASATLAALQASPIANPVFTEDFILRLASQIENNSFAMLANNTAVGRFLYPRASFFNHSCDPTCERLVGEDMVIKLKMLRDVAVGEEVTISYIDENRPRSARRENLLSSYHFNCACVRCEAEAEAGPIKYSYSRSVNNHARKGAKKRETRAEEKKKATAAAKAVVVAATSASDASLPAPAAPPAPAAEVSSAATPAREQEKTDGPLP